jgi:flagellar basal body-associated protein FliL
VNAVNITLSLGAVAAVVGVVLLIRWFIKSVRQSGADQQKASQDQAELAERVAADKAMQKARDEDAKKGGAKGALSRGDF